jgi:nanoRNase/pAp phosphatase (c-di-AMP/oligoRNAs hydrolase)
MVISCGGFIVYVPLVNLDVGALAVQYGGGGHVNAAGFSLSHNPFLPM